ncbi:MAG: hypothetical protein M5T61_21480 [Acidimicrobiia bacterium]|nr:hypothetical protein [Acidimicrobiia bacterium]
MTVAAAAASRSWSAGRSPGASTPGTPFEDATRADELTTAETTPDTAEITTTGTNRMAVALVGVDDDPDYSSGMPPDGWTAAGGFSDTGGSDARADLIYQTVASAAPSPPRWSAHCPARSSGRR